MDNQEDIVTTIVDQYKDTLNKLKNYHENKWDNVVIDRLLLTTLSNLSRQENKLDLNTNKNKKKDIILKDKLLLNIFNSFENNEAIQIFRWYDEETQRELKNSESWIILQTDEIRRDCIKEKWFPFSNNELALINSLLFDILWWRLSLSVKQKSGKVKS